MAKYRAQRGRWIHWLFGKGWTHESGKASVWFTSLGDWVYAGNRSVSSINGRAKTRDAAMKAAGKLLPKGVKA